MKEWTRNGLRRASFAVAACAASVFAATAGAATISIVPSTTVADVGATISLDVVVGGLAADDEAVTTFDLDLLYDASVFDFATIAYGTAFGTPDDFFTGDSFGAGRVDFALVSLLGDLDLAALQGDSVTLATFGFVARAVGSGVFALDAQTVPGIHVVGRNATKLEFASIGGATVRVDEGPVEVPEPGSALLALLGLAGLAFGRAQSRRSGI